MDRRVASAAFLGVFLLSGCHHDNNPPPPPATHAISGTVTRASGGALPGVGVTLGGGGMAATATTDAAGAYRFTGLADGSYTVTPALAGWVFQPQAPVVEVSGADVVRNFTASVERHLAGTVKDGGGTPLAGMTVRLSGASAAIATTDAAGGFTFGGLAHGASYTVACATFGYGSSPERDYTLAADVADADFTAWLAGMEPLTYAGTVSYSGTRTGPVYVTVSTPYGGGNPSGGTGLEEGSFAGRPFEVRNAQAGTFVTVRAWMDTLGIGRFNAGADPSVSWSGMVTPASGRVDVGALALADPEPPTVASPLGVGGVVPGDGIAIVVLDVPRNADGEQVADGFVVSWNDAATVDATHRLGSISVPAGPDFAIVHGLTNGTPYWFRVDAYLDGAPLGQPAVTTASTTPAAASGTATVTGTVTHPAVGAPSALYVVAQGGKNAGPGAGGIFFVRIANPTGTQTPYALTLPPGSYQVFGFVDVGDDGAVSVGEPAAFPGNANVPTSTFVAGSNAGPPIAIPGGAAAASLRTSRWANPMSTWTYLVVGLSAGEKRPVSAVLTGSGLRGPVDLGMSTDGGSGFELGTQFQTDPVLPFTGDRYAIAVTYADGTSETFERAVTGVFGTTPVAVAPADGATAIPTVPTFTWNAPTGAPSAYGYMLQVWPEYGDGVWETYLPGTATSVAFNADGTASAAELNPFSRYGWVIRATDVDGNDASYQALFTTGQSQTQLPLIDALDGTTLDGQIWQTPQYVRDVTSGEAILRVRADDMQAFPVQGVQYLNSIPVFGTGPANRVTTFRAKVTVPSGALVRTGTGTGAAGLRLIYQPQANRGFPFPAAIMNTLTASLELYDAGDGLRIRRRFLHCDTASCNTFSGAGITTVDPAGFTASADNVDAWAPAEYGTSYTFVLAVNETSGVITWSVDGGAYAAAIATGTGNVSTWINGRMSLQSDFTSAQLFSRAVDMVGGSSAIVAASFDDVYAGFNGGAATLWDNFDAFGGAFDPRKWGVGSATVDSDVWLSGGLHVASAVTTAVAGSLSETTTVNLMYPTSLRAMSADVDLAVSEPAAAAGSSTIFSMVGAFFNAGGGGVNDATGDVRGRVSLTSAGASYSITKCGNALCSSTTAPAGGSLGPTRPMTPGTVHAVAVRWDPTANTLTFAVDDATPVVVDVTQFVTVVSPTPSYPLHQLMTNVTVGATATAGTSSRIQAIVTNVRGSP